MSSLSLQEIESTLKTADPHKRQATLRAVADMFLSNAPSLGEDQVSVYDEVLAVLAGSADGAELVAISRRIAPVENAPRKLIRRLASDEDISIAGPVLAQSPRLGTEELCEIARSQGNAHLLAISSRQGLAEPLTDILISRGDHEVARSVAHNGSARLSLAGLERLLERAANDQSIGDRLRARPDVAPEAFQAALAKVAAQTAKTLETAVAAQKFVERMKQDGRLDEAQIVTFRKEERYAEVVASLGALSNLKYELVENMMYPCRVGGLVLLGKAMGLSWSTVSVVLDLAVARNGVTLTEVKEAQREFLDLSRATAERIVRFWLVRQTVSFQALAAKQRV